MVLDISITISRFKNSVCFMMWSFDLAPHKHTHTLTRTHTQSHNICRRETMTMKHHILISTLLLFVSTTMTIVTAQLDCGTRGSTFTIAGSSTIQQLAAASASGYMKKCPGVSANVAGEGSTTGARRLCNIASVGPSVEIGTMSRNWNVPGEAFVRNSTLKNYTCNFGTCDVTQLILPLMG
jgi:hypothetical protein